jgi:predicted amidophosphoribosyltransferase
MGVLRELLHDFTFGLVGRGGDEQEAPYRCVKCGAGFNQNHRACPECDSQFVAAVGGETEGDESGQRDATPWDR